MPPFLSSNDVPPYATQTVRPPLFADDESVLPLLVSTRAGDEALEVFHDAVTVQVLLPEEIVHDEGESERLPEAGGALMFALQLAVVPPFNPLQDHDHGPDPERPEKFPALQYPDPGADEYVCPFELPQAPLTGRAGATQEDPFHVWDESTDIESFPVADPPGPVQVRENPPLFPAVRL